MKRRRISSLLLIWAIGASTGALVAPTFAAFTSTTQNTGNTFVAEPDWEAPTATASVIRKGAGGIGGFIHQGGNYYVYANVTDSGNPASGVSTVTANVGNVTSGQTAASLSSGSWTVGGVSYNRRSAELTADSVLVDGSKSYTLTMTDAATNSRTQSGFSVTVDNIIPAGSDIQTQNKTGGAQGEPEAGDKVLYTYTELIEPESVIAGWTGASTNVVVKIIDNGVGAGSNDQVQIWNAGNTAQLPLGTIDTNGNYVTSNATFGATGTLSTMVQTSGLITVTLGTLNSGATRQNGLDALLWLPSSSVTDRAGNACSAVGINESGLSDDDF